MLKRSDAKRMAWLAGVAMVFAGQSVHATLIPLGEQILNGDFGTNATPSLTSWTASQVNARDSADTINTSTGASGFDGFFTSAFAVLGDSSGAIGNGPTNGSMTLSQSFNLPATIGLQTVTSYSLAVSFQAAFDGMDTAAAFVDLFSADLGTNLISWNSDANLGSSANFSTTLSGLLPGSYAISYLLTEVNTPGGSSAGDTNTAAGIDNVSVRATAVVPDAVVPTAVVPEPGILALLTAGLIGMGATLRRQGSAA